MVCCIIMSSVMVKLKSAKTGVKTEAKLPKIKATIVSKSTGTAAQPSYNYSQGMIIFALVLAHYCCFRHLCLAAIRSFESTVSSHRKLLVATPRELKLMQQTLRMILGRIVYVFIIPWVSLFANANRAYVLLFDKNYEGSSICEKRSRWPGLELARRRTKRS